MAAVASAEPLGVGEGGEPVLLDLKESAQGGSGPHGLCIGATGSGKSELLRTLLLGLAATHASDRLNMVLIDFKGGATFLGMAELPHVSAVITNLADELALVDRMADALAGEITRRQEALRAAGNLASVGDYGSLRDAGRSRRISGRRGHPTELAARPADRHRRSPPGTRPPRLDAEPHLLCFADGESGKTNLLRLLSRGITDQLTPEQARIVLLDYRRTLLGQIPDSHR